MNESENVRIMEMPEMTDTKRLEKGRPAVRIELVQLPVVLS